MTKKKNRRTVKIAWSIVVTIAIVFAAALSSQNDSGGEQEAEGNEVKATEEVMAFSYEADHYYAIAMRRAKEGLEIDQ